VSEASIFARVPAERVAEAVPSDYRDLARLAVRLGELYIVLLFPHDRSDVVVSSVVRRAFRRLDAPAASSVLAVGANFTQEALGVIREPRAVPITLSDFY
jgi:hypothetical protein